MPQDLAALIAAQLQIATDELARIGTEAATKTAAAQARITALTAAQAALTPEIQTILANLQAVGVTIAFSG